MLPPMMLVCSVGSVLPCFVSLVLCGLDGWLRLRRRGLGFELIFTARHRVMARHGLSSSLGWEGRSRQGIRVESVRSSSGNSWCLSFYFPGTAPGCFSQLGCSERFDTWTVRSRRQSSVPPSIVECWVVLWLDAARASEPRQLGAAALDQTLRDLEVEIDSVAPIHPSRKGESDYGMMPSPNESSADG